MQRLIEAVDAVLIDLRQLRGPGTISRNTPADATGFVAAPAADIQWGQLGISLDALKVELARHKAALRH